MNRCRRTGFTLVELLVVMTIIGVLMALLLPAVTGMREAGRLTTCENNQKQVAVAMFRYEAQLQNYPGYVNELDGNRNVSWPVVLFQYMGRADLWELWRDGNQKEVYIETLICPSNPPEQISAGDTSFAYPGNCGMPGDNDRAPHGLLHNHGTGVNQANRTLVSMDFVSGHDGATNTLMLTENIAATNWTSTNEARIGVTWQASGGLGINDDQEGNHPRPSSYHGDGVMASYCDARQKFLSDDIDYAVYVHLMTPYGKGASEAASLLQGKPLDDDDF